MSVVFHKPKLEEVRSLIQKELKDIPLESLSIGSREGFNLSPIYLNAGNQTTIPFLLDYRIVFQIHTPDLASISTSNLNLLHVLEQGQNGCILNFNQLDWSLSQLTDLFLNVKLDYIHTEFLNASERTEKSIREYLQNYPHPLSWFNTAKSSQIYCISDDNFATESAYLIHQLKGPKAFIHIEMSGDYFRDISKIRAFKTLLFRHAKLEGHAAEYILIGETNAKNKTLEAVENNLLKLTTEAMSALIGGCDGIWIKPHNQDYDSEFGTRIARNIFHLMQEEAYLHLVNDVSKGSYFIENYTEKMAISIYEKLDENY